MVIEGGTERHIDYDPWGTPSGAVAGERQTFNAQEQDHDTKLFDLSDRKLDAMIGGFPSPDRLWEKFRSLSPYVYCANNPLGMTDPGGMQAEKMWFGESGGGSAPAPAQEKGSVVGRVVGGALQDAAWSIVKSEIDMFAPIVPVIEFASGPKEYVGGYVTAFENATGQNGGEKAARFWLAQAIAVGATYGAVKVAGMRGPVSSGANNAMNAARLRNQLAAQEIAGGHAFAKHAAEFGFNSPAEMAAHIENVMNNPTMVRSLSNNRTAYWHSPTNSVVIRNPGAVDGGTTFVPKNGVDYFSGLR